MEPLIITANDPMVPPGPNEIEETIRQGVEAAEAGAAIIHHHLIYKPRKPGERIVLDVEKSVHVIREIRKRTDAIFQLGITLATNESRKAVALAEPVDMMSITLADNDHYNSDIPTIFRDREDMVELAQFCKDNSIVPEWEVFHAGAAWNLRYLINKGFSKAPHWVNLTMYPEGSSWSPRTFEEMDHRARVLPEGSKWHLVAFARSEHDPIVPPIGPDEHTRMLTYAILRGGHVRMGIEDRPEVRPGVPAKTNAELVRIIADISERLGRPVATPAEARRILNMPAR
jgi:3-keto-5-aminohexanoate cleavage enzyme